MARPADAHAIRSAFLSFFEERGHAAVPSSPLVPFDDPTLLFVNAGMVQFKDVFTGRDKRDYTRATSAQRCLRAGGKHNDLDNVGFTPRHHTLFEMLGNFSFGDYFKRDAIRWGWEFLTQVLELPAEKLVVSVFNGEGENAPFDQEAYDLWAEIIPKERIYAFDAKENFWQMGDTGPCGPCSEIHIWRGEGGAPPDGGKPGKGPAFEDDKYMELWNLVFMQYEKLASGEMTKLPAPSVDTGAGLERLAAVLEGVETNYETGLFVPIVDKVKALAGVSGHQGEREASYRVIADHARATAFLIADGVTPDQTGRPYVLRRIMRRAIRHATLVGLEDLFFHEVCDEVVDRFGEAYPELREAREVIAGAVKIEEEGFRRTLARGLRRVSKILAGLEAEGSKVFPVDEAADLYTSAGFPIDLTRVIAEENELTLDEAAVAEKLEAQKGESSFAGGGGSKVADVYFDIVNELGQGTAFLGYGATAAEATLKAIVIPAPEPAEGEPALEPTRVESAQAGQAVELIFDQSPFYGESGGQVGDTGVLRAVEGGATVTVTQTSKPTGGLHVHHGELAGGSIAVGQRFVLEVDVARRDAIRRNHSATHMLHHALRKVLGKHVAQKGSLVAPDRLRFDFSHARSVTREETRRIEAEVNAMVLANAPTGTAEMSLADAKQAGAIGLFGEKYGAEVRVVTIGEVETEAGEERSVELCGGTHVARAGDVGLFKIVGEGGVAQGVRRIEAMTGMGAVEWVQERAEVVDQVASDLRARDLGEVLGRLEKLHEELAARGREIDSLKRKLATGGGGQASEVVEVEGGGKTVKLTARRIPVADPKIMREAADTLRDRMGSGVVVLAGERDGKANLLVATTKDLAKGKIVHAGKLAAALVVHVDGRGGGRPDMAQAGGPKVAGLDDVVAHAAEELAKQLA